MELKDTEILEKLQCDYRYIHKSPHSSLPKPPPLTTTAKLFSMNIGSTSRDKIYTGIMNKGWELFMCPEALTLPFIHALVGWTHPAYASKVSPGVSNHTKKKTPLPSLTPTGKYENFSASPSRSSHWIQSVMVLKPTKEDILTYISTLTSLHCISRNVECSGSGFRQSCKAKRSWTGDIFGLD